MADGFATPEHASPPTLNAKRQIKKATRNLIFRYVLEKKQVAMADISRQLVISLPTITQHIDSLKKMGILIENGLYESTGGRRAKALSINPRSKVACGINITHSALDMITVDLLGGVIDYVKEDIPCRISREYLDHLQSLLTGMFERNSLSEQSILGVGISLPAIVDGRGVIYDTAFETPLPPDFHQVVQARVPAPITFVNDASSGGYAEFWHCKTRENLFYLSLSETVGGAAKVHGRVLSGNDYRSAEVGHTTIIPDGRPCYCGQRGCMNTYCSSKCLSLLAGGSLTAFFQELETGNAYCRGKWNEYLDYLAIAINNIRLLFDCEVILGGGVGRFIPEYVPALSERLRKRDSFHRTTEYLRVCEYHSESSAVGAALMFVDQFIAQI
jgi:predicted NBD/HSP70 family sugar kinase